MGRTSKYCLLLLALIVCVGGAACAAELTPGARVKLKALDTIIHPTQWQWRYKVGDNADAQNPSFDDSAWQTKDTDAFVWGNEPVAWLRMTITIPERVCGVAIAGSRVTFKCGVDDDGVVFVNGKEISKFHWDQGNAVISENAVPGAKVSIAIKGINTGGPGGLQFAKLEYSALDDVRTATAAFLASFQLAGDTSDAVGPQTSAPYQARITHALSQVDSGALDAGNKDAYLVWVKAGDAELRRCVEEMSAGLSLALVGHAHIDFAYLWAWPETQSVCKNTFSTLSGLMDQYPFVFSQSQAALYEEMKRNQPAIYAQIKDRVRRGQWDVSTASAWSEGDTNIPSGEATVRSYLLANRFIKSEFGIEPTAGWAPDTFGHSWALPQILAKSGIKSYTFMRGGVGKPIFWWQSADGSRVLAYNTPNYNGGAGSGQSGLRDIVEFAKTTGQPGLMRLYGVGDHGGGPTKDMLVDALQMQKRAPYPKVKFSSVSGYFDTLAATSASLPAYQGEINGVFEGCYTSHSDIKRWNRECENTLAAAEVFSSIAGRYGGSYHAAAFEASWRKTCFNQFHDIICGSAIHSAYEYAKQLHDETISQANSALEDSLDTIAEEVDTEGVGGVPIIVFNPLAWPRTEPVTVASPFPGEATHVKISDSSGKSYPGRTLGDKLSFTARNVPAMGYRVFWVSHAAKPVLAGASFSNSVLENQFYRVRVDPKLGIITGIYDKVNKRSVLAGPSDVLQILLENSDQMSAWNLGGIEGSKDLIGDCEVVCSDTGPAKVMVWYDHKYGDSVITQELTLYDGVPRIDIKLTADWKEKWGKDTPTPMLKAAFRPDLKNPKATFEIPFGSIERARDGREVVGQKWIDLSDTDYGVSLLNDCKYGFDVKDNTMRISLLRASQNPDPMPDQGVHEMTYSLYPHSGDWRAAGTVRRGYELNEPLIARVVKSQPGVLPSAKSFLTVSAANIAVTALKKAQDDGNLILRFYETSGRPGSVTIHTSQPVAQYLETDLMERPIGEGQPIRDGSFTVKFGKNEIKTYKLLGK